MRVSSVCSWATALTLVCAAEVATAEAADIVEEGNAVEAADTAEEGNAAEEGGDAQEADAAADDDVEGGSSVGATAAEKRRKGDASVDRNILMPSAETINAGDVTFNSYELVLAGLTYGVTDDIAVSATVLLPIVEDFPRFVSVAGKFRLYAGSNDIFSLQPNLMYFGVDGESAALFGVHALYDHLFDDRGRYTLSLAMSTLGVLGATEGDVDIADGAILGFSGAFNAQVAEIVKVMAELYLPGAITPDTTELVEEALLLNYGVRFFGETLAVDLTFLRPIHPDAETPLVMGIPFVTFSARF